MPMYSFRCRKCGHTFDELVNRFGGTAPCPQCGSSDVERAVTAPAAHGSERIRTKMRDRRNCGPPGAGFG